MKKTVLITGASRGIGRATALRFAREGYQVCANFFQSEEMARSLQKEIDSFGGCCKLIQADVRDFQAVSRMFKIAQAEFGKLDALVANAGISRMGVFTSVSEQDWDDVMGVNAKGVFHACKGAVPLLLQNGGGSIVTVSSMWGTNGSSCETVYSASKGAVIAFTKALAKELGPSRIRVNCVAPGVVATDMLREVSAETVDLLREQTPLEQIGTPEQIADSIFYLSSEAAAFITGSVLPVNGGFVI